MRGWWNGARSDGKCVGYLTWYEVQVAQIPDASPHVHRADETERQKNVGGGQTRQAGQLFAQPAHGRL